MKEYTIIKDGIKIKSNKPGKYAGWNGGSKNKKIFGTLDCASGKRMNKENRVFFHSIEDAIKSGYRPCKKCKPVSQERYEEIKNDLGENKMNSFERNLQKAANELREVAAEAGPQGWRIKVGGKTMGVNDLPKDAHAAFEEVRGRLRKDGHMPKIRKEDDISTWDIILKADGSAEIRDDNGKPIVKYKLKNTIPKNLAS